MTGAPASDSASPSPPPNQGRIPSADRPADAAESLTKSGVWSRLDVLRNYGIVIAFIALFVTLSLSSDAFLTERNLTNLLDQSAAIGIIACGATLVIIAGGFDLSVSATFAVAGVIAAKVTNSTGEPIIGMAAGLMVGVLFGIFNALLITIGRVNTFIATLASSIMFRGIGLLLTSGMIISVSVAGFQTIGQSELFGAKYSVWIFAAFTLAMWFLLARTTFGRYIYASGGNPEAARLSGIRVGLVRGTTFVISGFAAALAGIIVASRVSGGQADAGLGMELTAIAAVVIGGTSIMGGEGAIWRTVLGVLLLAMITNGSNLLNLDPTYEQILQGAIIVSAVSFDAWSRRRS